jgi:hypothetical protein
MGRATGNPKKRPPTPKALPAADAKAGTPETCKECKGRPCKNGKREWFNYGCWCGGDTAPAVDAGIEGKIPPKEGDWDQWVIDNNLPQPEDEVDKCCVTHDLELGRARNESKNPKLGYNSVDPGIAAINARLARCFKKEADNEANGSKGQWFAYRGEKFFNHVSENVNVPSSVSMGDPMGYWSAGADGAATGAAYSVVP